MRMPDFGGSSFRIVAVAPARVIVAPALGCWHHRAMLRDFLVMPGGAQHGPVEGISAADVVQILNLLGDGYRLASQRGARIRVAHQTEDDADRGKRMALDLA